MTHRLAGIFVAIACTLASAVPARGKEPPARLLMSLSIEELADVEVTSVSRKSESLLASAAAVYVVTQEDIRRSGVTSLVEALRLAPGVEVARISGNQWAVGIRGFASRLSRSVLVLIDGRSVYTTLFAGTYWEVQDTLLADVDRIEVVRGPGGTLWGANAVNGVINIITKKAGDTLGGRVSVGAGSEERAFAAFRYGGKLGKGAYRVYGKHVDRDEQRPLQGAAFDAWERSQLGFRTDLETSGGGALTIQGDGYTAEHGERLLLHSFSAPRRFLADGQTDLSGANLLARWSRTRDNGGVLTLQGYYDYTHRRQADFSEDRDVVDLDLQHRIALTPRQNLTWGTAYRATSSTAVGRTTVEFSPEARTENLLSAYVQDEIHLGDKLRLTLGTKLEHNDFTGFEFQPSGRLAFIASEEQTAWVAVSKAVRSPSRVENDVTKSSSVSATQPLYVRLIGDGGFRSERVIAYEAGYRRHLGSRASLDVAAFYNDLDYLTTGEQLGPFFSEGQGAELRFVLPFGFRNGLAGHARGFEIAADAAASSWLKLRASYSYLDLSLAAVAGSGDQVSGPRIEGSSPRHRGTLAVYADLPRNFGCDLTLRVVDDLPALAIPGYTNLDLRLSYRPTEQTEISLVGQGLLEASHLELDDRETGLTAIQRGFYGKLTWRF